MKKNASPAAATPAPVAGRPVLRLHEDRYFDSDVTIRAVARALYEETRGLPLICPHGHVDPRMLATDAPFPEPTTLLVVPDHYIFRMLHSQGIPMESLGIPTRDGTPVETDPRAAWRLFAAHMHLFRGTPTGAWLDHEFHDVFGLRVRLCAETADFVYDALAERLVSPEFRPRALFERFNIEVLATTDSASDPLVHHQAIRDSGWKGRVIPTFRPDGVFRVALPSWRAEVERLGTSAGMAIASCEGLLRALEARRRFFRTLGTVASDHGVLEAYTTRVPAHELEAIFQRGMSGTATPDDQRRFEGHLLIEMARMSTEDGLVMQLHPGALRDYNRHVAARFGPDMGADIPVAGEFTRNLRPLLDAYGNDPRLMMVLFTLDETNYARELAPLAGHYPSLRLGPSWWFHDSIEGMTRFRAQVTETAGIYNTAGFNDDTRAFCSIPARHDLSRRVDANFLAGLVTRHIVEMDDARVMARALAYELARSTYRLDGPATAGSA